MSDCSVKTQIQCLKTETAQGIYAVGIDAGSRAVKLLILDQQGNRVAQGICEQGVDQQRIARNLLDCVLANTHLPEPTYVVATGYARNLITFAQRSVTEISCHARGVRHCVPGAASIVEIGGQDSKIIFLNQDGGVRDFLMNDRCAAGTGRFLEVVADRLKCGLPGFETLLSECAPENCALISSMCVVFAETEIIGLLASGASGGAILRGVQKAVASRVCAMCGAQSWRAPVVFTGGVALVPGMKEALSATLNIPLTPIEHPQFTGALGAALMALDSIKKNKEQKDAL